jgi:hypothetical protein
MSGGVISQKKKKEGIGFKNNQRLLVDEFVQRLDSHIVAYVQPSQQICQDKLM